MVGNGLDNLLAGQGGDDTLAGWRGNDLLMGGAGYDTYALDVTLLASKNTTLTFSSFDNKAFILDNIRFSPVAVVPEPATWALLGMGGALFWVVRQRSNRP